MPKTTKNIVLQDLIDIKWSKVTKPWAKEIIEEITARLDEGEAEHGDTWKSKNNLNEAVEELEDCIAYNSFAIQQHPHLKEGLQLVQKNLLTLISYLKHLNKYEI